MVSVIYGLIRQVQCSNSKQKFNRDQWGNNYDNNKLLLVLQGEISFFVKCLVIWNTGLFFRTDKNVKEPNDLLFINFEFQF